MDDLTGDLARFSAIDPLHRQLVIWPGHGPILTLRPAFREILEMEGST